MNDFYFEWDDTKELINISKHGINFTTASRVFLATKKEQEAYWNGKNKIQ